MDRLSLGWDSLADISAPGSPALAFDNARRYSETGRPLALARCCIATRSSSLQEMERCLLLANEALQLCCIRTTQEPQ